MARLSYSNLNAIEEIAFIAGTNYILQFQLYSSPDGDGDPIELTGKTFEWKLAPYGQKNYVALTKEDDDFTSPDSITKQLLLAEEDTENLSGKYFHQLIITDADGTIYRPGQGIITIISKI